MTKRANTIVEKLLQHRKKQIELVLRLEFPGSHARPPPEELPAANAVGQDLGLLGRAWDQVRWQQMRARRTELRKMTTEQLAALGSQLSLEQEEHDRERREKQTPKAHEPEWQFWTRRSEEWPLHDAALLLVNLEPRKGLGLHLKGILHGEYYEARRSAETPEALRHGEALSNLGRAKLKEVQEMVHLVRAAHRRNTLDIQSDDSGCEAVEPGPFLCWARDKGYEIPDELKKLAGHQRVKRQRATTKKATAASAKARRSRTVERDRRIHEAAATGVKPKQIGANRSIVGDRLLSADRIRGILRKPKP